MASAQEGILAYTQPTPSALPSTYYPGPGPAYYYPGDAYSQRSSKKKKGSSSLFYATTILLILLVVWLLYYMSPARVLTRRLVRAGWILYTKPGCPYCVRQESVLRGKFWKRVDCKGGNVVSGYTMRPPLKCNDAKITGFPYWYNHLDPQKSKAGLQSWSQLQKMAG